VPCTGASRIHALRSFIRRDGATGRASPTPWFSLELLPFSLHGWREMRGVRERKGGRSDLLARRFPEQLPHLLQRVAFALGGTRCCRFFDVLHAPSSCSTGSNVIVSGFVGSRKVRAVGWPLAVDDVSAVRPGRPGRPGLSTSVWHVPHTLGDTAGIVRVVMLSFSWIARTRESCVDFDKAAGCVPVLMGSVAHSG
jgi:hypothetical protein